MYRYLHLFILLGLTLVCQQVKSQFSIELVDSTQGQTSFRGLSVVTDKVVWVSGSKGTVGLSKDAGKSWKWMQIPGFEKSDFRDIEAFDKNTAIIMASGTPAVILKTVDGGDNWKVVFRDNRPEMFLDAMDFWDNKRGMLVGDPINGRFVLLETTNGGDSWRMLDSTLCPEAHDSEAVFAASGTSLRCWGKNEFGFVTGGKVSRLIKGVTKKKSVSTQDYHLNKIIQGKSSQGAFSFLEINSDFYIGGGDYLCDTCTHLSSCYFEADSLRSTSFSDLGYTSCVEYIGNWTSKRRSFGYYPRLNLVWTGSKATNLDFTIGHCFGSSFKSQKIEIGFNVVMKSKAKKGKAVFLAGSKGRIAKLIY